MRGLKIGKGGDSIENEQQGASDFSLLAKGDGSEVIFQKIQHGKMFYVHPAEESETMEFFYIIEGKCSYKKDEENIILDQGDYFYVQHLQDSVFFSAMTDMKLLWYTTKPAFHYLSHRIAKLSNIVKQVEGKDNYTYQHSVRVQEFSFKIARMLKLTKDRLEDLYFATLFHDIGKINIPEEILNKPGSLTKEEFDIIKRHSYDGYIMVKDLYYTNISQIILQHHERLDGSGYPNGLKEDDILLEARIIGIADTFDAMTSDRPYRKGLDPTIAMAELKRLSGIHYDSELVNLFEKALIVDGVLK
ncbi:HD domain-containing phosphohydrolase [Paenibacillus sp. sgz500958]|uniref:HD domain-containing phosphohydrolase n=1 Tax=Paenibacillus sp. sgz500958 TaxID=3242475 RepID=UPI0036D257FE